jgi:hypothetical protein
MMKIEFLPKQNNLIYRQTVEVKYGIQAAPKAMNFLIFQIKLSAVASNLVSQKKQREEVQNNKIFLHKQVNLIPIK